MASKIGFDLYTRSTCTRVYTVLFWPGMSAQIEDRVAKCDTCSQYQRAHAKEPMVVSETPDRPWAKVGADLFEHKGTTYLLTINYYSKWIEVDKLDNLTSKNTISYLKSQFARHGIPDELRSDNSPQFGSAEFAEFATYYGFVHTTSSPRYPQANGEAEREVQTIKTLLKKVADPYQALLNYRNTPLDGLSLSSAQLLMGRRLKTMLPTTAALLHPQGSAEVKNALEKKRKKNSTMTSTVERSCLHFTPVTLSECRRAGNGNLQQYYTSTSHPGHMLLRLRKVPGTAEIEGSYTQPKFHYKVQ